MKGKRPGRQRIGRRLSVGLACLAVAGCAAFSLGAIAVAGSATTETADGKHSTPPTGPDAPLSPTESFGLDLLGTQPAGNAVLSPLSAATALAMAGTGAAGETAAQIATTLGLKGPARFDSVGALQAKMLAAQTKAAAGSPEAPTLALANGLFVQQGFSLRPPFVGGLQTHFGATPEAVDFSGDPTAALAAINGWGSAHTNGIIPEMLAELPTETRLVLTNAVYMKAKWQEEFERAETFPGPFHRANGKTASVEFMHQTGRYKYGAGSGYKAIELPYRASTLSLLVVLPTGRGVAKLERRLREDGLGAIVGGLRPETVKLSLPRFHLRTEVSLVPGLQSLGMKIPFTEAADFSGITATERLMIGAIEHVADIDVDEEGTEAAATTGIAIVPTSAAPVAGVTFKADRPFLFFVRDDETGAVLFAGRLTDPLAAAE